MNVVLLTEYPPTIAEDLWAHLHRKRTEKTLKIRLLVIEPSQEHAKFYQAQYRKFLDLKKRI